MHRTIKFFIFFVIFYVSQGFSQHQISDDDRICKQKRAMLITGCARSGTGFIATFFKANHLNVGHEENGSYGIVAWPMAVDSDSAPWGPGANTYSFEHIFHQVRHPLKAIASASNEPFVSWIYIQKFVPEIKLSDSKIVKGAKYWYYWNLLAEKKAEWTYRIEDVENQINEMKMRLGIDLDPTKFKEIPKNTNTRGYRTVYTWKNLKEELSEDLFNNIVNMALRYGYEL